MNSRWVLGALLATFAAGCNCGKPPLTKTEASLTLGSDTLDFGPVTEGTSKSGKFRLDNTGRAPVSVLMSLGSGTSADFALSSPTATVEAGGFVEGLVIFTPKGPGEDTGVVDVVAADKPDEPPLHVNLHGGPIGPALTFDPDPLDFKPATLPLETKTVQLRSVGTAALTIRSVGVAGTGNPDFSVVTPATPSRLLPGESLPVRVEYARSFRTTEGLLEALSDDADAGLRRLRLLPDPPAACADGADNDGDGLSDFPNDPGCQDAQDTDEYNPSMCVTGATQPCGGIDGGLFCAGTRSCVNNLWGTCVDAGSTAPELCNNRDDDCDGMVDDGVTQACYTGAGGTRGVGRCRDGVETCAAGAWVGGCVGEVRPAASETCGNSIDDDCDTLTDEGCTDGGTDAGTDGGCNPNGIYTLDAGSLTYTCCFGIVDLTIRQFQLFSAGRTVMPGPTQPGGALSSTTSTTCPAGSFDVSRLDPGGCAETYRLTGTFVGPDTFVGTYSASFSGSDCDCFGVDTPCTNQSWPVSAGR